MMWALRKEDAFLLLFTECLVQRNGYWSLFDSLSITAGEVKNNSSSAEWISISFLMTERHTLYDIVENFSTERMIMSKIELDEDTKKTATKDFESLDI